MRKKDVTHTFKQNNISVVYDVILWKQLSNIPPPGPASALKATHTMNATVETTINVIRGML